MATSITHGPVCPPVVAEGGEAELQKPELLARPEACALLGYTRRLMFLPRHRKVAAFSYSTSTNANWLFLIDVDDGTCERFPVPNGEIGSHGASDGPDQNIYTLTHSGSFYRFDVPARRWDLMARPVPPGERVWGSVCGPNWRYYFGTYPNACFGEVDLVTDRVVLRRHVLPDAVYCDSFTTLPGGIIRCRAWGATERWLRFDPSTRQFAGETPEERERSLRMTADRHPIPQGVTPPAGDEEIGGLTQASDGVWYGVAYPSTRLCRVSQTGRAVLLDKSLGAGDLWRMVPAGEDLLCAVSMLGRYVLWHPSGGRPIRGGVDNRSPDANTIMFLEASDPRSVVGAHYSQQNLFDVDVDTGEWNESHTMVARVSGEPMCAAQLRGKVYLGVYVRALLMEYDPARPYRLGTNPREIVEIGHEQTRPTGMCADGSRVFMVSHADYGKLDGALTIYDAEADSVDVIRPVVPGHNLETCAYDPATGHVFCGTSRWGDCRSCPPTQPSAVIAEWSPDEGRLVRAIAPWEGADAVAVWGVLPGGVLLSTHGSQMLLLDTASGDELCRCEAPWGSLHALRIVEDGSAYGLGDDMLFEWRYTDGHVIPLARTTARHLAIPRPGTFILAEDTSILRVDTPGPSAETA